MKRYGVNAAMAILLGLAMVTAAQARSACLVSDDWLKPVIYTDAPEVTEKARSMLRSLVAQALSQAQRLGAARLLAEAATLEVDAAQAARWPSAALTAGIGYADTGIEGSARSRGRLASLGISVSAPIYDSGRSAETIAWREHLADSARLAEIDAREQVALQTVSLALERSRYFKRGQVSRQHSRRLGCVVEALQKVVRADPGRRSELDQARKSLLEAELSFTRSETIKQQVELRLQRLVGDALPRLEGLTTVLADTPPIDAVLALSLESAAIQQRVAQADAAAAQSRVFAAESRPRVDLALNGANNDGIATDRGWQVGVNLVIPLLSPGTRQVADAAARRALAAGLDVDDVRAERRVRVNDVHTQAASLLREGQEIDVILESSARVREATLRQWQSLGKRSLFDVMTAERDHFGLRLAQVDTLHDRQQANALLWSLGAGVDAWLRENASP